MQAAENEHQLAGIAGPGAYTPRHAARLLAALLASLATYGLVFRWPRLVGLGPLRNLLATLAATPLHALAAWLAGRLARPRLGDLALLFFGVCALRLALPLPLVEGSDDAYRYLWDGRVQSQGLNPYLHAPHSAPLAQLRDQTLFPRIFRPDMRTVYPPLAQLYFFLAHALSAGSVVGLKLIYLLHELASTCLLCLLLRRHGKPVMRALLYAWSPLPIVQAFAGAHLDVLLLPWLLLALLIAERRPAVAGFALGCSAMVRPVTALCGPALALRRPWRESLLVAAGFAAACALLVMPYLRAGPGLIQSLATYAQHWRFNGSIFPLLTGLLGDSDWLRPALYGTVAVLAVASGWLRLERPARALIALGAYFVLAPTVYPWYLLVPLALGTMYGGPLVVALPALIGLSDLVMVDGVIGGEWEVPRAVWWLEYAAIYGLLIYEIAAARRRARARGRA